MIKYGKILVATDFSSHASEALRRAAVLGETFEAEVHLLHVLSPTPYFETDMLSVEQFPEIDKARHKDAIRMLERQAARVDSAVITHLHENGGDIAQAICAFAKETGVDLIITGRHNQQTALEHMFIGSVAERIVRFAGCSVMVVVPHPSEN